MSFGKKKQLYITHTHTHTIQRSVQLHRLLVESPHSSWFHINSVTCFGHTEESPVVYDDFPTLLYSILLLYNRNVVCCTSYLCLSRSIEVVFRVLMRVYIHMYIYEHTPNYIVDKSCSRLLSAKLA